MDNQDSEEFLAIDSIVLGQRESSLTLVLSLRIAQLHGYPLPVASLRSSATEAGDRVRVPVELFCTPLRHRDILPAGDEARANSLKSTESKHCQYLDVLRQAVTSPTERLGATNDAYGTSVGP